ncbi:MAG: F0F1 ATP synthase subunit A [Clostridia bacterium]|nr:F0F1 ATP synthase subunit A [Clostridia bacterium]
MAAEHGHHEEVDFITQMHHNLNIWGLPEEPWHLGDIMVGSLHIPIELNAATVFFTWVAMALTILIALVAARGADVKRPGKMAAMFELLFDFWRGLINQSMDPKKGAHIFSLVVTFFLFLLMCNLVGLLPTGVAPTADTQTTFAFAMITFSMIFIMGIKYKGAKYFKHYLQPYPFFLPIVIIEDLAKPLTLAFRLFGNMKGKEIMILALLGLITGTAHWAGGFLGNVIWLLFSIFVSAIQAFVFTILTVAYIGVAVDDH